MTSDITSGITVQEFVKKLRSSKSFQRCLQVFFQEIVQGFFKKSIRNFLEIPLRISSRTVQYFFVQFLEKLRETLGKISERIQHWSLKTSQKIFLIKPLEWLKKYTCRNFSRNHWRNISKRSCTNLGKNFRRNFYRICKDIFRRNTKKRHGWTFEKILYWNA